MTLAQFVELNDRYEADIERQDWRFGMVASVIAEVNRNRKKKSTAFKPEDFMPRKKKQEKPGPGMLKKKIDMVMAAFGGEIKE